MATWLRTLSISLLILALAACDLNSLIYTDTELSSMYGLELSSRGQSLTAGSIIEPGQALSLGLLLSDEAPEPDHVDLRLFDKDGQVAASIVLAGPVSSRTVNPGQDIIPVQSMRQALPAVLIPDSLEPGYYQLDIRVVNAANKTLTGLTRTLLLYQAVPPTIRISLHPARLGLEHPALVKAGFTGPVGPDAWIRWSIDGKIHNQGPIAERYDRFIWTAPDKPGIHNIQAEFFPFEPPAQSDVLPYATLSIKAPVNRQVQAQQRLFEQAQYRHYILSDRLIAWHQGTEPPPRIHGRVYPEVSGLSFGMAIGDQAYLESSQAFIPWNPQAARGFGLFMSMAPLPGYDGYPQQGSLYRVVDSNQDLLFELGVYEGKLFINSGILVSGPALPNEDLVLSLNAHPHPQGLQCRVSVNGLLYLEVTIDDFRSHSLASNQLAGLAAVYDEIVITDHTGLALSQRVQLSLADTDS